MRLRVGDALEERLGPHARARYEVLRVTPTRVQMRPLDRRTSHGGRVQSMLLSRVATGFVKVDR